MSPGAMLSQLVCKLRNSARPLRKHAEFAKSACFRGRQYWPSILQKSRESMAPKLVDRKTVSNPASDVAE